MAVYTVIEADGVTRRVETTATGQRLMAEVFQVIGTDAVQPVNLRSGSVMLLDARACEKQLPVNTEATRRYRALGHTGIDICGTVVIAADLYFE